MYPQFWRGLGIFFLIAGVILAGATGIGAPIIALLVAGAVLLLGPIFFVARRAAGGGPETDRPNQEKLNEVSDPDAPPDATPKAPHGYTPST
jgi:hypothetical protein